MLRRWLAALCDPVIAETLEQSAVLAAERDAAYTAWQRSVERNAAAGEMLKRVSDERNTLAKTLLRERNQRNHPAAICESCADHGAAVKLASYRERIELMTEQAERAAGEGT